MKDHKATNNKVIYLYWEGYHEQSSPIEHLSNKHKDQKAKVKTKPKAEKYTNVSNAN